MKKLVSALLLLALSSCSQASKLRLNLEKFPLSQEPGLFHVSRSGDNYPKQGIAYSYAEAGKPSNAERIIAKVNGGESALLFLHQDYCHTCLASHDNLMSVFIESGMELASFDFSEDKRAATYDELNMILDAFPSYVTVIHDLVTPSMYLLSSPEKAYALPFLPEVNSLQNLEEYFRNILAFDYVFTFSRYDAFYDFLSAYDCLAYLDGGASFYYDSIYPLAKGSPRFTARIEASLLSAQDQRSFASLFGEGDLALFQKGEAKQKENSRTNPESSETLVKGYYA